MHRQKNDFNFDFFPLNLAHDRETVQARHINIKHGNVRSVSFNQLQSRFTVARFADDEQRFIRFNHLPRTLPDNRMVVRDDDFNFCFPLFINFCDSLNGILIKMVVPPPTSVSISCVPPSIRTLSDIPKRPKPPFPASALRGAFVSNPFPLSEIKMVKFRSLFLSKICASAAAACLTTLLNFPELSDKRSSRIRR